MSILAIDPGTRESGYVVIDTATFQPVEFAKSRNHDLVRRLGRLVNQVDHIAIEQIGHYGTGMPAGRDVFDTCRWIGRFEQIIEDHGIAPDLVLRAKVKTHLCGTPRAKDSNITQALVDRFAPGAKNHGKGTKANPGWFHGFHADVWQAYALAVYAADTLLVGTRTA